MLLKQYRELRPTLQQLADEASNQLRRALKEQGIYITAMEHRVKTEKSLTGKLELKGAKYKSIDDITDLVGLRVITFYTEWSEVALRPHQWRKRCQWYRGRHDVGTGQDTAVYAEEKIKNQYFNMTTL